MILSEICIDCKDAFKKELKGIMDMIFNVDDNKHPRMQWAILTSFAILSREFSPDV